MNHSDSGVGRVNARTPDCSRAQDTGVSLRMEGHFPSHAFSLLTIYAASSKRHFKEFIRILR